MVKHISDRELKYLKDGDFLLLQINYNKAIKEGKSDFEIHHSGFEGSPHFEEHIRQFAFQNNLSYDLQGMYIKFHIL
ncbi:hypothetical protein [Ligilactobacillus salivarius]|uniref:hypothetical protein n=1 Tax=Ligilactobacillus salivarius TaxID=1624 RepID=UPI00136A0FAD|nr:hypothetical protein [Ligilactobacillus salivarius]MDE1506458.1 hypothetical protein [Ligilactobacillus salivarius]MDE1521239.1 hypothetical protein [Ligilactobacillus salivarius]MYU81535.1 hypothetical protein [Ligilactobacillus salivarius]MYU85437.1 hypothetical protein [Ligilactobacillus salivarius]MYU87163.1 hypothetical protein [Ligilactobacillus salivarius]